MRFFSGLRKFFMATSLLWALVYAFLLYHNNIELLSPLSMFAKFPAFLLMSSDSVGAYVFIALGAFACVLFAFCIRKNFAQKWYLCCLPALMLLLDLYGQVLSYMTMHSADFEANLNYYYYNGISPSPDWFYILIGVWDLALITALLWYLPIFHPKKRIREQFSQEEAGITTDNWEEILCVDEENKDDSDKP